MNLKKDGRIVNNKSKPKSNSEIAVRSSSKSVITTMTTQPTTCDCPNGGKDYGVIVFDIKAHLPTCKFRRKIAKDYETLFVITDTRSYISLNSRVESLGPETTAI